MGAVHLIMKLLPLISRSSYMNIAAVYIKSRGIGVIISLRLDWEVKVYLSYLAKKTCITTFDFEYARVGASFPLACSVRRVAYIVEPVDYLSNIQTKKYRSDIS